MASSEIDDVYELSPLQSGMLLHSVHDGAADMYLGQHSYEIEGPLDGDVLIEAWRRVFAAHPAMRTSFHWEQLDKPLQVVHHEVSPLARRDDWSGQDEEEQRWRLELLMAEDRAAGFDLTKAPLQRLHLIRLGPDRHALAWTHHHLLLDGWSVPVFMNEVLTHYRAMTEGSPTPPPAAPYRDYIAWLQRQDAAAAEAFWRETLNHAEPCHLPALRPLDPRRGTGAVERRVVSIAGDLETGLRKLAAHERVTLNAVMQAAWSVVLRRLTGRPEVMFGCVSSGRPADLPAVDRMVGLFVNTLPVPVTVPDDGDLGDWLRRIQDGFAAIRRYEFSPLSDIKKWAAAPGQQLFESLFILDNYSFAVEAGSEAMGRLRVRSQGIFDKVSVPLALITTPAPISELHLLLHRDRFDDAFADGVIDRLTATLRSIVTANRVKDVVLAFGPLPDPLALEPEGLLTVAVAPLRDGPPEPPATPGEEAIAAVYCDILQLPEVDVTTSFFALGGDSFGAIRVVGRLDGATVALLAMNPSVRALAAALQAGGGDDADVELDAEIAELERRLAQKTSAQSTSGAAATG